MGLRRGQVLYHSRSRKKRPEPARITVFTSDFASPESFNAVFTGSSVLWKRSSWAGGNLTGNRFTQRSEWQVMFLPCFMWCLSIITQTISKHKSEFPRKHGCIHWCTSPSTYRIYSVHVEGRRAWTFWCMSMHFFISIHTPRVVELLELCSSQCFGEIFSVGKSWTQSLPSTITWLLVTGTAIVVLRMPRMYFCIWHTNIRQTKKTEQIDLSNRITI